MSQLVLDSAVLQAERREKKRKATDICRIFMWLLCTAELAINRGLPDLSPRGRRTRRVSKCVRAREGAVQVGAKVRVRKVILEEGSFLLLALLWFGFI